MSRGNSFQEHYIVALPRIYLISILTRWEDALLCALFVYSMRVETTFVDQTHKAKLNFALLYHIFFYSVSNLNRSTVKCAAFLQCNVWLEIRTSLRWTTEALVLRVWSFQCLIILYILSENSIKCKESLIHFTASSLSKHCKRIVYTTYPFPTMIDKLKK